MNILVIASLLPVPDLIKETEYVLKLRYFYEKSHPGSRFLFIRPVSSGKYYPMRFKTTNQKSRDAAIRQGDISFDENEILIWPYYSIGRYSFLHSIFSKSIIFQIKNRREKLRDFSPDIIHAHFLFPDGFLAKILSSIYNIPFILTMQDECRFIQNSFAFFQSKIILEKASALTTLSPKMESVLKGKGYNNVQLILPGIDESFFNQSKSLRTNQSIRFVTAANLIKIKNIKSVIEAMALLDNRHDITYTIIGDGPEKQNLLRLSETLNQTKRVRFLPSVPNSLLAPLLAQFDVYVQPSYKESFGLSYFEALACGLPVILTNNTGAYQIIKKFNVYKTVNPYDIYDIADKILNYSDFNIIDSQYLACKQAAQFANWTTTISNLHTIYIDIIRKANE